jgi:hypothetical protein
MAEHWNLLHDFVLLNLVRLSLMPERKAARIFRVPAFLNNRLPEPYETAALGYEASWAGVFTDPGKEGRQ